MKTSSKAWLIILAIIVLVALVLLVHDHGSAPAGTPAESSTTAVTSPSALDTSSWKTFSDAATGFSVKYPADLQQATVTVPTVPGPYVLALTFPPADYFTTVLADQADVFVTATPTCPAVQPGGAPQDQGSTTVTFGQNAFITQRTDDVGAGNRYETVVYDVTSGGLCYRVTFYDHGANGAGLYLSDPDAIAAADATHDSELSAVQGIVDAMLGTVAFSSTASAH